MGPGLWWPGDGESDVEQAKKDMSLGFPVGGMVAERFDWHVILFV